jgi:hypothetical protein
VCVFINHVINSFNYKRLPDFVEFVASKLERTPISFSVTEPMFREMMNSSMIPKHTEIRDYLIRALDLCYVLRVPFYRLASKSGIPLCILNGNPKYYHDAVLLGTQHDNINMIKTTACSACNLSGYCLGLNRHYAWFYGTEELHPLSDDCFKSRKLNSWDIEDKWFNRIINTWLHDCQSF